MPGQTLDMCNTHTHTHRHTFTLRQAAAVAAGPGNRQHFGNNPHTQTQTHTHLQAHPHMGTDKYLCRPQSRQRRQYKQDSLPASLPLSLAVPLCVYVIVYSCSNAQIIWNECARMFIRKSYCHLPMQRNKLSVPRTVGRMRKFLGKNCTLQNLVK